jgi:hypothetical protein
MDRAFESEIASVYDFSSDLSYTLSLLWGLSNTWTPDILLQLCAVYIKFIDYLPLAASFAIDSVTRLQTLSPTCHIGTDACIAAVLAKQSSKAIELLDCAHGLIWTQALHQRDLQMEGAPPKLAAGLAGLLRAISVTMPTHLSESSSQAHHKDTLHKQNTWIQALLHKICGMPGLERFMLGSTYTTLCKAAHRHPVVVLVAGWGHALAFVISSADEDQPCILHLDLTSSAERIRQI